MKRNCLLNGLGRFGLHLLRFYLKNYNKSNFEITSINDSFLKNLNLKEYLSNDKYIDFSEFSPIFEQNKITFNLAEIDKEIEISISSYEFDDLSKTNNDILLECSGLNLSRDLYYKKINQGFEKILLSHSYDDADTTFIYKFDNKSDLTESKLISYGSCTVNCYTPFAAFVNKMYEVKNSHASFVHNLPQYKIDKNIIEKKYCTLQSNAPKKLSFLNDEFIVDYTLVPYTGVSMFTFIFETFKSVESDFIFNLDDALIKNKLESIYGVAKSIKDPNLYKFTEKSGIFDLQMSKSFNNKIYLTGVFDNENSVNRYFDVLNLICH